MDAVAAQDGVAARLDLHARERVGEDVVVLQRAATLLVHVHACLLAIMDAVAAQTRIGAAVNSNASDALTADIAVFEVQATSGDINAVEVAPELTESDIRDATHSCLEQYDVLVCDLDHHVIDSTLTHDLQWLIDDEAFPVQSRVDLDNGARLGRLDGGSDRRMVSAVQLVDNQRWRLGFRHPG